MLQTVLLASPHSCVHVCSAPVARLGLVQLEIPAKRTCPGSALLRSAMCAAGAPVFAVGHGDVQVAIGRRREFENGTLRVHSSTAGHICAVEVGDLDFCAASNRRRDGLENAVVVGKLRPMAHGRWGSRY